MKEFVFIWDIKNISSSWHKTGEKIVSPKFIAGPIQNSVWTLRLYPRGSINGDYFSLQLRREVDFSTPTPLTVHFEFSCILAHASMQHSSFILQSLKTFENDGYSRFEESCFMQRSEVFGRKRALYLPRDTLTLRCRIWQDDGNAREYGQCYGLTRFEIERIITVKNICHLVDKTFRIQSEKGNKDLMSVSVLYYSDKIDVKTIQINRVNMKFSTCKLSFMDKSTRRKLFEHESCYFGEPCDEHWKFPFSDRVLTLEKENSERSDIEMTTELVYSTGEETKIMEEEYSTRKSEFIFSYMARKQCDCSSISDAMWTLYAEQVLCDVELKLPEKSFYAHKCVLFARSPVFLKMLTNEMKEKKNNSIDIKDISAETMEIVLRFLYTDQVGCISWDALIELYYASDIYDVELLKLKCCSYLLINLDVGKVFKLLFLANRHNDSVLKRQVNEIIWEYDEAVFGSLEWKKFADEQEHIVAETMHSKYERKENQSPTETCEELISSCPKMEDEFLRFYYDKINCDILIKSSDDSFPAHKVVLSASSITFREAFMKDSSEESATLYDMKDWDSMTISLMLRFLYGNPLQNIQWDMAMKLYHIAVEFKIQLLKCKSACFLVENLMVSNAIDLLMLAHEHGDIELKSTVEDFIHLYDEEIFGSIAWADFCKTNSLLAVETMRGRYKKQR